MNLKLSKNKVNYLTRLLVDHIEKSDDVDYNTDIGELRLRIYHLLMEELRLFAGIEEGVREKILAQKKNIPEGSREYEILFRKYATDELNKLSKVWD